MERKRLRVVTLRYLALEPEIRGPLQDSARAAALLAKVIGDLDRECFVALHLNVRNQVISSELVSIGTLTSSLVHPREVLKAAILQNAAGLVVGHNHPSGDCSPSPEDIEINSRLRSACDLIGIRLLDSVIVVPGGGYWSAADTGSL